MEVGCNQFTGWEYGIGFVIVKIWGTQFVQQLIQWRKQEPGTVQNGFVYFVRDHCSNQ